MFIAVAVRVCRLLNPGALLRHLAAEGRTVFSRAGGGTRVGEHLGPAELRLSSDPHDPALAVTPFVVTTASSKGAVRISALDATQAEEMAHRLTLLAEDDQRDAT